MRHPQLFLDCLWLDKFSSIALLFCDLFVQTLELRQPQLDFEICQFFGIFASLLLSFLFVVSKNLELRMAQLDLVCVFFCPLLTFPLFFRVIVFPKFPVAAAAKRFQCSFFG